MNKNNVFDFDEAISLLQAGATGFVFRNTRSGLSMAVRDPESFMVQIDEYVPDTELV
jgi:hypothetical protein